MRATAVATVLFLLGACVYHCPANAAAGLIRGAGNDSADVVVKKEPRMLQGVGAITSIDLINAMTDLKIVTLSSGQEILVSSIPGMTSPDFNLEAKSTGIVQSVIFALNGVDVQTENAAPWAFCGNSGSNFKTCPSLGLGQHFVTATPYSSSNGGGIKGTTVGITFTIVAGPPGPTASPAIPSPTGPTYCPVPKV
jgi:hypothetical protein